MVKRAEFMESDHGHDTIYYGVKLDGKLVAQNLSYSQAELIVDAINAYEPEAQKKGKDKRSCC